MYYYIMHYRYFNPTKPVLEQIMHHRQHRQHKQKGGDFTDIPPDQPDPNTAPDPYANLRFWKIIDFLRTNSLTR